jgi:hypothetical protein
LCELLAHSALSEICGYRATDVRHELTTEINSLTQRLNLRRKADLRLQPRNFSLLRLREPMRGSTPRGVKRPLIAMVRMPLLSCDFA